ncbi:MAG: hypothetical protein WBP41_01610 [Saprospiraceae bacterium]
MTSSAKSVYVFGLYLYLVGLTLIFVPNLFLQTLHLPETNEVWIRIVGLLAFVLGFYYHRMAAMNITAFFKLTIPVRLGVFAVFVAFVLLHLAEPVLILIGAVDLAGAIWTWSALKKETA